MMVDLNESLYKVDVEISDIFEGVKEELSWYKDRMMAYRETITQDNDRIVSVYPSNGSHRLQKVKPGRLKITEHDDFTTYWQKEQGTWMYFRVDRDEDKNIKELIDRVVKAAGYTGNDVQTSLSFKGPGYVLESHVDLDCENNQWRYHVIIESNPDNFIISNSSPPATFWAEDEDPNLDYKVIPQEGEVWALKVTVNHSAGNRSESENSYHFIIDLV